MDKNEYNDLSYTITKLYNDEMTRPEDLEKIKSDLYLRQAQAQIKMHAEADRMLIMQMQQFIDVLTKELEIDGEFLCKTNTVDHRFTQPSSEEPCQTT